MGRDRASMLAVTDLAVVSLWTGGVVVASFFVESPMTMVWVLAATLTAFSVLDYRRNRDVLSPMILTAAVFGWLYVAKPLYVLDTRVISSGTEADALFVGDAQWERVLVQALVAATLTFCAISVGHLLVMCRPGQEVSRRRWVLDRVAYEWVAAGAVALGVMAFGVLVSASGGLADHVEGLALRSESLAGLSFLTLATVPVNLTLVIGLTARLRGDEGAPGRVLLTVLLMVGVVSALLTGGRAALITGLALPVLVTVHYAGRRVGPLLAGAMAAVGVAAFLFLGAFFRDVQFGRVPGLGHWYYVRQRFDDLHGSLVGGVEAVPFDSLVRLVGEREFGDLPLRYGATYQAIATWPVPRAMWSDKPVGGGNAWFSETYVPRFYGEAKVETSISYVGESYVNFGWPGVIVGGLLLGLLSGVLRVRLAGSTEVFGLPLYAALLGLLLTLIRGDAYHNVTSFVFVLVVWFGLRLLLGRAGPEAATAPPSLPRVPDQRAKQVPDWTPDGGFWLTPVRAADAGVESLFGPVTPEPVVGVRTLRIVRPTVRGRGQRPSGLPRGAGWDVDHVSLRAFEWDPQLPAGVDDVRVLEDRVGSEDLGDSGSAVVTQ